MLPFANGQPQYTNGPPPQYANQQPNAIPYANAMPYNGQQPYNGQYGVQQLYPPQPYPNSAGPDDRFGATSVVMPILCCGGPMLLASIGLYCTVQGKVKNDINSLFYAGMVLLALALVLFCVAGVWICKNPPSSSSCLSAMMGMNTCVQCCSLAGRLADV